jgi:hypothetical protein
VFGKRLPPDFEKQLPKLIELGWVEVTPVQWSSKKSGG